MNEHPFKSFIELIEFDQTIRVLTEQVEAAQRERARLQSQIHTLEQDLKGAHDRLDGAKKIVTTQEARLKELEKIEKEKKDRLEMSGNYKEYQAVKGELDKIQVQQISAEREVTQAWKDTDIAQKFIQNGQKEIEQKISALESASTAQQQIIEKAEQDIAQKISLRASKEQGIPDEWLEKYTLMRSRVVDPVVPILRDGCSVCFYSASHQELMRLKQRALLQCKGCFRLLYLPEAMQEAIVDQTDSSKQ